MTETPAPARLALLGDPILKRVAQPFAGDASALIQRLTVTMRAHNGIGLAAPQIGESVRVIVIARDEATEIGFVNPRITWRSTEQETIVEGCLSIPGYEVPVRRPAQVKVESDNKYAIDLSGLGARAVQHEIDHLDGILILDRWLEQQAAYAIDGGAPRATTGEAVLELLESAAKALREVTIYTKGGGVLLRELLADCDRIATKCEAAVRSFVLARAEGDITVAAGTDTLIGEVFGTTKPACNVIFAEGGGGPRICVRRSGHPNDGHTDQPWLAKKLDEATEEDRHNDK